MRLLRVFGSAVLGIAVFVACSSDDAAAPGGGDGADGGTSKNTSSGGGGGSGCKVGADCASGTCGTDGKCTAVVAASATDGIKNNGETDIDCGGASAPKCGTGKTCSADTDCTDQVCSTTCQAASATDTKKNGDETDVDCGGTSGKKCDATKSCLAHADCKSDGCDDTMHCALAPSCTQSNGGLTCGTGEFEDANKQHESCCTSLALPNSTTRLDKYEITAGRMRAFIERTKGNVRSWYDQNSAGLSDAARASVEPFKESLPVDLDSDGSNGPVGAKFQVGAFIYLPDRPSTSQGCYTGNANDQAFGAHTYSTGTDENEDRAFDQAFLDRLSLNCVPYPMVAAFCAWDGGRVQTLAENDAAYGGGIYPWGNTPEAGGFQNYPTADSDFIEVGPGGITIGHDYGACPGCDAKMMNWSNAYQHPEGDSGKPWDLANFISPPGRFPKDKGAAGHMDLGGNMMEWVADDGANLPTGDTATDPQYGAKKRWSRSGSWEGHQSNNPNWQFAVMTKYGKTGGRCARD